MAILCYHDVGDGWPSPMTVSPARFREHCAVLAERAAPLTTVAGLDGACRRGAVAITFDDGFTGVYEHALPALRRFGIPATVFVVAATLPGGTAAPWWLGAYHAGAPATLSLAQIHELREAGVQIGSHSWAHRDLVGLDEAACVRDLRDSRELLETLLGERVDLLAYPRGLHDARVRAAARRAGYRAAFALPERAEPAGRFAIPRVGVYAADGAPAVRLKAHPAYRRVRLGRGAAPLRGLVRAARRVSPGAG